MRTLLLSLLALATLLPARSRSQALDPAKIVGRWSGTGSFFNADLQKQAGSVPFVTEFRADRSGTGRVGEATLQVVRVTPARDRIEVRAKLTGFIGTDPMLAKDRLVFVITRVEDSTIQAEFHLKSNFTFDPRMREGRVVLTRMP